MSLPGTYAEQDEGNNSYQRMRHCSGSYIRQAAQSYYSEQQQR
jgi:hypothetical protein